MVSEPEYRIKFDAGRNAVLRDDVIIGYLCEQPMPMIRMQTRKEIAEMLREARKYPPAEVVEAVEESDWPDAVKDALGAIWHMGMDDARKVVLGETEVLLIQPGDVVEHCGKPELDSRQVVNVGPDWLTLDILGKESDQLPKINYRVVHRPGDST